MRKLYFNQMNNNQLVKHVTNSIKNHGKMFCTYKEVEGADLILEKNKIFVPTIAIDEISD